MNVSHDKEKIRKNQNFEKFDELRPGKTHSHNTSIDSRFCMHYISTPKELGTRNESQNEFTDFSLELIFHRIFPLTRCGR